MEKVKEKIKSLFSTPKRAIVTTLVAVFALFALSAGGVFASVFWELNEDRVEYAVAEKIAPSAEPAAVEKEATAAANLESGNSTPAASDSKEPAPVTQTDGMYPKALNEKKISRERAEEIALADAGFSKNQITNLHSYYEMDDGYHQYDIQFFKGELEYEYAIDADSGAVMERDMDHIYD